VGNQDASLATPARTTRPDAIALLGPTASGKSAVSMALAERLDLEIVSVDSALVYRGMDIGTAKPSVADRTRVPHHLIDLIDPLESYSAARFVADATRLIGEIRGRGRLPLLVGGTMLYVRALMGGLDELPGADPQVRARLDAEAAQRGWPALHARLAQLDPITAARLEPGDSQRIQRALEVHALTGQPMSALLGRERAASGPGSGAPDVAVLALEPSDRSVLHARIARRFADMRAAGLLDEVRALRARGDLRPELPSMRCVGYRQSWEHLDALAQAHTPADHAALQQRLIDTGVAATRQLAKRQLTWLRSMPGRLTIDCLAPDLIAQTHRTIVALEATPLAAHRPGALAP
jgi:tRNA dimethylallyltransferase